MGNEQCAEVCKEHSGLAAQMKNFTRWQESQNGTLQTMQKGMSEGFLKVTNQIGVVQEKNNQAISALKYWIMGTLAMTVLSFLGTIIVLLNRGG